MLGVVVFLVGLVTSLTGAFIRSCETVPAELFQSWCGSAPHALVLAGHQHCAGCALMASGLGLVVISPMLTSWTAGRAMGAVSK